MEPGTNGNKVSTEFEILTFERGKNRSKCVCTLFHICRRSYNFHCYLIMGMSYCLVSFPSGLKNRNCLPHLFYSRVPCQVCRGPPGGPWLSHDPDTECRKPAIFEFRGKMAGLPLSQPLGTPRTSPVGFRVPTCSGDPSHAAKPPYVLESSNDSRVLLGLS